MSKRGLDAHTGRLNRTFEFYLFVGLAAAAAAAATAAAAKNRIDSLLDKWKRERGYYAPNNRAHDDQTNDSK